MLDVLEGAEDGPELAEEAAVVVAVVVTDDGLDGLGGLVSLVERNLTAVGSDRGFINWNHFRSQLTGTGGG